MKPPRFAYHDPASRSEALALLEMYGDDAKILSGGQSLVPLLNMRLTQPAHLVDINRLPALSYIHEMAGNLVIGALTRHCEVERSALVRQLCPLLAEAMPYVGHAPIRSRGTLCGSLAHADPSAELPAVLLALGGHVHVEGAQENRTIAAEDFFVSELQTALTSQELLSEARFPITPPRSGVAFIEVSRRHGDFALVGVALQVTLRESGAIDVAHIALFGVAETPIRAHAAEALLAGNRPDAELFRAATEQAIADLSPTTDIHASADYRRAVAGTLVSRALALATSRASAHARER